MTLDQTCQPEALTSSAQRHPTASMPKPKRKVPKETKVRVDPEGTLPVLASAPAAERPPDSTAGRRKRRAGDDDNDAEAADFMPLEGSGLEQPKQTATKKKKRKGATAVDLSKRSPQDGDTRSSVVWLGRIPHGFYEDQMRGFFSQFGVIKRLRLSRNQKTGGSRHFAYIEFESPEVAAIVAECMNNYLLFGKMLQCQVVPLDRLHPNTFKGANRKFRTVPFRDLARDEHNRDRTAEEAERAAKRLVAADERRRQKMKEMGIEYEFEGFKAPARKGKKTLL